MAAELLLPKRQYKGAKVDRAESYTAEDWNQDSILFEHHILCDFNIFPSP